MRVYHRKRRTDTVPDVRWTYLAGARILQSAADPSARWRQTLRGNHPEVIGIASGKILCDRRCHQLSLLRPTDDPGSLYHRLGSGQGLGSEYPGDRVVIQNKELRKIYRIAIVLTTAVLFL